MGDLERQAWDRADTVRLQGERAARIDPYDRLDIKELEHQIDVAHDAWSAVEVGDDRFMALYGWLVTLEGRLAELLASVDREQGVWS